MRHRHFPGLTDEERERLEAAGHVRRIGAHGDIIRTGDAPRTVKIVLEGWVARYIDLPDGRRQILALMLPGDVCDANAFVFERMDHSLGALTPVRYAEIGRGDFERLMDECPNLAREMWRHELVTVSIQRQWTANIGQRMALERIAHLLCETLLRLQAVGLTEAGSCDFPLTQIEIADATGLTPVHVNRTLRVLREQGLAELRGRRLNLIDPEGLRAVAMFDPAYLHLAGSFGAG